MKLKDQIFFMEVAKLAALRSHAIRLQVGGVVCDARGDMVAFAYNGTVHGMDNCCEDVLTDSEGNPLIDTHGNSYLVTKPDTIHCEPNLIAHAARRGISIAGGSVFITHSPCQPCAALMLQAGIRDVYFGDEHRSFPDTLAKYGRMFNRLEKFTNV